MSDERKDLPPANAPNFDERLRETLSTYLGNRGDKLDRGVTLRDLTEANIIQLRSNYLAGTGGKAPVVVGPGSAVAPSYEIDLTPPPTPSGFTASAAISNIFIEHDAPFYSQGHGHARTIVYGATWPGIPASLPTFSNAVKITEFTGTVFAHPSNPSTTWHLWIKWISVDGVLSSAPAGGTNGLQVTTAVDVRLLTKALTGQITDSQLYADLGARINLIDAAGTGLITRLSNEVLARGNTDSAINTRIDTVISVATTDRGVAGAAVTSEASARTNADGSLATRIDTVQSVATTDRGAAASAITSEQIARSSADGALGSRIDTVQATATTDRGTFTTAISTEQTARASADGTLFAQYSVKVDTNGYVAGFGLSSTANNAVPTSAFAVRADQFYIASPSGPGVAPTVPFIVRTTPTTINGVYVPVGVYIQDAFIANGTISNAKIGNAAIDDAKIANLSASKLTAGQISVGASISSSNYIAGSQGWMINGSGAAEFSGVVVRGTIYATTGTFSGTISASTINGGTINSATLNSASITSGAINLQGDGGNGWGYIRSAGKWWGDGANGWVFARQGADGATFAEMKTGVSRIWSSSWNDCGITFPGISMTNGGLTIDQIDVIKTVNIAGNAITIPLGYYVASAVITSGDIAVLNYTSAGQPVVINFSANTRAQVYSGSQCNPVIELQLYRNGTLIRAVQGTSASESDGGVGNIKPISFSMVDYPPAGNTTYRMYFYTSGYVAGGTFDTRVTERCLTTLECKR